MEETKGSVGKSQSKIDGMQLVMGKPLYTDDLAPKDALIIKILRSPHAFAKIKNINKEKAEKIDGVECILTHKDVPKIPFTRAGQSYPEPSTYDKYILDEYVRYIGDEVAIVAAVNEDIAIKAIKLIKVEYEVFEPVLHIEDAENHLSKIHFKHRCYSNLDIGFNPEKNIAAVYNFNIGNVEETLKECDVVINNTYHTQAQAHAMMETYRAFSYLDQYGRLTIVTSTQIPFHIRRMIGRALELPISQIRIIKPRIGGGFGGKQNAQVEFFTAIVTMKTGKSSKIIYTRKETFESSSSRHAMKINVTIGATLQGKIKAIDMNVISNTGAYGEHASTVLGAAGYKSLPLYNKVESVKFTGKAIYTNHTPGGALRGYGVTQGTFALESSINELATKLNIDPIKLREKNMLRKGETSEIFNKTTIGAGKEPIYMNSCELDYCIQKGKELIDWDKKYPRQQVSSNKVRGVGMSIAMQGSGIPGIDTATATIKINDNGYFTLLLGATDIGTGSDTILRQIAAEALGIEANNINVYSSDTDLTPFDVGAYASGTTYFSGNAVKKAAITMKKLIEGEGAKYLKINLEDVIFDGKEIKNKAGDKKVSLVDLCNRLIYKNPTNQLTATESFGTSDVAPPFVSGFAEVEVDTETGKIDLINYVSVVDSGTIINPKLARIQTEGGIVQGIGMALFEEVRRNSSGRLGTNDLMKYRIPSRLDINNIIVDFANGYDSTGPFGAKSIGEVVTNTPCPAIADAIFNAIGIRIRDLPITPEKVKINLIDKE